MRLLATLTTLSIIFAFYGCGEQPSPNSEEQTDSETQTAETAEISDEIVLPDGWAMTDAISAAEVEAIMGTPGFGVFPEAASSASSGRPVGSYNVSSVPYSKVRFDVNVSGGTECYETAVSYLSDPSEIEDPVWDIASIGEVTAGERTSVRIVVLKGDLCFNISWEPEVFPSLDRADTSVKLAQLLITNLYGL